MKKKKLKLDELKIQSFITELKPDHAQTAKGGSDVPTGWICSVLATIASIDTVMNTYDHTQDYSWWNCGGSNNGGGGGGQASEVIMYGGCLLPTVTICG